MLKQFFLLVVFVLCAAAAPAPPRSLPPRSLPAPEAVPGEPAPLIQHVEILEFGTYQRGPVVSEEPPTATSFGRGMSQWEKHVTTTRRIPARIGTSFGFRYRIVGSPVGEIVPLTEVILLPAEGVKSPPGRQPFTRDVTATYAQLGQEGMAMFTFDYPWEMVAGIWTIQFWSGAKKIAEQSFEIYIPPLS
jgi:hypothetical protein